MDRKSFSLKTFYLIHFLNQTWHYLKACLSLWKGSWRCLHCKSFWITICQNSFKKKIVPCLHQGCLQHWRRSCLGHGNVWYVQSYVRTCVRSAVCMFPLQLPNGGPAGQLCVVSSARPNIYSTSEVQQIHSWLPGTFQRVSVPVNSTSPGFHTSQLMCVWHADGRTCRAGRRGG